MLPKPAVLKPQVDARARHPIMNRHRCITTDIWFPIGEPYPKIAPATAIDDVKATLLGHSLTAHAIVSRKCVYRYFPAKSSVPRISDSICSH